MAKAKSKAAIMIADGRGEMAKVQDRRFETGDWPIRFEMPTEQADTWLRYFFAECERRGWSSGALAQMEAHENSGSITVNAGRVDKLQLTVVWERKRGGAMQVRARSAGVPEFPQSETHELFEQINERCRSGAMECVYGRGQLEYDGLPWRGELWLDHRLRLGPPSRQDETALLGPRVILVDALVDCVGRRDSADVFGKKLRELSAFLSVVMGVAVQIPKQGRVWTWTTTDGVADCAVRNLGYAEQENPQEMPGRDKYRSMPLRQVNRPDFSLRGVFPDTVEESLPADAADLWATYCGLTADQRRQFLQAAAKWQEALTHSSERSTLSFALMVIACEALKPTDSQYREHNIYHVVEALLGKSSGDLLRKDWFRPQDVRNAHLHRGEFRGSEFVLAAIMSNYYDPTFDQARRTLALITQEAIIEWLRRRGAFTMPGIERRKTVRRWVKEHALTLLPIFMTMSFVAGWSLRTFWRS